MPEVIREGGFRFFSFPNEGESREPIDVHVRRGAAVAKVWIEPAVAQATNNGFNPREMNEVMRIASSNRGRIAEAWHVHFGD